MRAPALLVLVLLFGYLSEIFVRYNAFIIDNPGHPPVSQPSYLDSDGAYYRATILSLLQDHDLDLRNNLAQLAVYQVETNVALGGHGELFPKRPLLLSIFGLPFYAVAGDSGLLALNVLVLLGLSLVLWRLARREASEAAALAIVFAFMFLTLFRINAYNFSPDLLSTLLVVASVAQLLESRPAAAGLLLGLSICARITNAIFLPLALVFVARDGLAAVIRFVSGLAPFCFALLLGNYLMFGSPFVTPYDRVMVYDAAGHEALQASHRALFSRPTVSRLWSQLFDPRLGLFTSSPPIVLAIPGFALLWLRSRGEALLCGSFCAVQFAFFSAYDLWDAAPLGPRFLMTVVALSVIPAAATADSVERRFRFFIAKHPRSM